MVAQNKKKKNPFHNHFLACRHGVESYGSFQNFLNDFVLFPLNWPFPLLPAHAEPEEEGSQPRNGGGVTKMESGSL